MTATYILNETTSDLTGGGGNFNVTLPTSAAIPNVLSVGGNPTDYGSAFTASGVPGTDGATGDYTVEMNVTTANSDVEISVQLHRVNSSGTVQTSSSVSATQSGATTGVKTFTFTNQSLGTWASGDRLRVDYIGNRVTGHGTQQVVIGTQSTNAEVVTPFGTAPQNINVGLVTETDTSQTMTRRKQKTSAQSTETDTSQTPTRTKSRRLDPPGYRLGG